MRAEAQPSQLGEEPPAASSTAQPRSLDSVGRSVNDEGSNEPSSSTESVWHREPPIVWVTIVFVVVGVLVFRYGFVGGNTSIPQGTNAVNAVLQFWYLKRFPFGVWLYPFTDWGQPFPGFTGPTILLPAILGVSPPTTTRFVEFVGWILAGPTMYATVRNLGGTPIGGTLAGFYYTVLAQTPELFEAHVPSMLSLGLAPIFLLAVYRLFDRPRSGWALAAAILLYLLASIGDLGILYFLVFFAVLLAVFTIAARAWIRP